MFSKCLICIFVWTAIAFPPPETEKETTTEVEKADVSEAQDAETSEPEAKKAVDKEKQSIEIAKAWKRLGKNQIWINETDKKVMVRGSICLREGPLEMFACPLQTKEHESVIAVEAKASEVHACFVALGFGPGKPVQWQPEYRAASGPMIGIDIRWKEDGKEKTVDAKSLVRQSGTEKTLDTDWAFGGSEIFIDRIENREIYYADSGEMICLSNFPTAMMDVPIESSDSAEGLLFEANTDAIPAISTQVYLIMTPRKK